MKHEDLWDVEAAESYDTPGTGMFAPEVLDPAVDRLTSLAEGGAALEFAIGTGRVAIPLSEKGISVSGIEIAPAMLRQLRTKASENDIPVVLGDMTMAFVPGQFNLIYLVFNGISNLMSQQEQVECFHNAARIMPRGTFVRADDSSSNFGFRPFRIGLIHKRLSGSRMTDTCSSTHAILSPSTSFRTISTSATARRLVSSGRRIDISGPQSLTSWLKSLDLD